MKLKEVKIKNFRGYGENSQNREGFYEFKHLDRDFVLFQGYNGFGKTSFFEAIEWCITDEVGRLTDMYSKKTYSASELKKSYYLKFYHHENQNNMNREVKVLLLFDDGLEVTRTSKSKSLKTTSNDKNYRSVLTVKKDGEMLESIQNTRQLLHYFLVTDSEPDSKQFVNTHLLAQDRIHDFLSEKDPKERNKVFLQLLNLDRINSLFNRLDGLKKRSAISSKRNEIELELSNLKAHEKGIQSFLDSKNFGSMEEYIKNVNVLTQKLINLVKYAQQHKISLSKIHLSVILNGIHVTPKTCVQHLHNMEKARNAVRKEEHKLQDKKINQHKLRETLQRLLLLEQLEKLVRQADLANQVQTSKYDSLLEERATIKQQLGVINQRAQINKTRNDELTTYKSIFKNMNRYLVKSQAKIQDSFWEFLDKDREKWASFLERFEELLKSLSISPNLPELETTDWNTLRNRYDEHSAKRKDLYKKIVTLKEKRDALSEMNEEYRGTLDKIRELLSQQEFTSCPVCLNEDFSQQKYQSVFVNLEDGSTVNNKIEALIDVTLSSGNTKLKDIVEEIAANDKEDKVWKERIQVECIEAIQNLLKSINKQFSEYYNSIDKLLQKDNHELDKQLTEWSEKQKQNLLQLKRVEDSYRELFKEDITKDLIYSEEIIQRLKAIVDEQNVWFESHREQMSLTNLPTIGEIRDSIKSLLITENLEKYYPKKSKHLDDELAAIDVQLNQLNELGTTLTELTLYKVPDEHTSKFEDYANLSEKIGVLDKMFQKLDRYDAQVDIWHAKISDMQKSIVEKKLKAHPIISWVYETINPHPFYNKLIIENGDRGALFTNESADLYLDQIFSAAQLNILALSVFLGLGLSSGNSILNQLFLDDPIQSMDDLNILAFIDVLRAVMDSSYNQKKIILSTHNDNFARLLAIKMRNRQIAHYKFSGYGDEGPIYEWIEN